MLEGGLFRKGVVRFSAENHDNHDHEKGKRATTNVQNGLLFFF